MTSRIDAIVTPALLIWARKSAGYSIEEAAKKVPVKPEQLENWEQGEKRPTVNQLRTLANTYKRPLAVFYLSEPPEDFQALRDYRRLYEEEERENSPKLRFTIRQAWYRREIALDLFEQLEGEPPLFSAQANLTENPEEVGTRIRHLLNITYENQIKWRDPYVALNAWRSAFEQTGILIFQASGIEISEMRGLSISESPLPVIVLNSRDSARGRIFTMLHEFAHLMLREGGVCDLIDDINVIRPSEEQKIEIFCNYVAGAAIIPAIHLLNENIVQAKGDTTWLDTELDELVHRYQASPEAVLRRLLIVERTTEANYQAKREEFLKQYKERAKQKSEGRPPFHRLVINRAGPLFTKLVLEGYNRDYITASDVSDYLETRLKHIPKIESALLL